MQTHLPTSTPPPGTTSRLIRRAALFALVTCSLGAFVAPVRASAVPVAPPSGYVGVPLPPAWEICVLSELHAPLTAANVADLDLWQIAEGGSTANSNNYNPYNTKRGIDASGASLPHATTSNGFPAFANWPAGCAATTATILQPNMALIARTLQASSAPSPAAFLSIVDQTPWCAPDNGHPCYSGLIAEGAFPASSSAALALYAGSQVSVAAYGGQVAQVAALASQLGSERQELAAADQAVAADQQGVQAALDRLRSLAVFEYTSNTQVNHELALKGLNVPDVKEQLTQFYESVATNQQVGLVNQAKTVLVQAQAHRDAVAASVNQTTAALAGAQATVARTENDLRRDAGGFVTAGACGGFLPSGLAGAPLAAGLSACLSSLA